MRIKIILGICILLLCIQVFRLRAQYEAAIQKDHYSLTEYGVRYTIWHHGSAKTVLYIADLLGTNIKSAEQLEKLTPPTDGVTRIIVPSIHALARKNINPDNLLSIIGNANNVVLADNFCILDWESVKKHAWFQGTNLHPGSFCFSENESRLVDRLIKQYHVTKVVVYADNKPYVKLIDTFLKYLEQIKIPYEIIYP